jgi:spore germination protein KB
MVVVNICVLFVLGDLTPGINYSVLYVSRYIRISDFFEHLEAVVVMVWIMGAFIKLSVFYYVFVIGFANWAGLPNYRPYVFPIGLLIYFFGYWVAESMQELGAFIATSGTFYILTGYLGIPTLLLCVLQLRKWTSSSFRAKLEKN